jgi:hypothetical protein
MLKTTSEWEREIFRSVAIFLVSQLFRCDDEMYFVEEISSKIKSEIVGDLWRIEEASTPLFFVIAISSIIYLQRGLSTKYRSFSYC